MSSTTAVFAGEGAAEIFRTAFSIIVFLSLVYAAVGGAGGYVIERERGGMPWRGAMLGAFLFVFGWLVSVFLTRDSSDRRSLGRDKRVPGNRTGLSAATSRRPGTEGSQDRQIQTGSRVAPGNSAKENPFRRPGGSR